ncbi:sulfite exporter TauE/SafE family protein [Rubrobacter taiwanensis]|jgi:uncharacterized membrane protein YfcA|uniref:Probable membrane transporter protein n=1 Tax=Rubrobacter taiwanensis TaxID=185139 RepID=A0A4R1BMA6_9ACTN|nr:sulfite exporter TauE/SafE family protein [Rubrobacter taiwanensis]TCJ18476.1 sulfite exporter TauE/SafE family protein [Rubrobacter taiwanensis]
MTWALGGALLAVALGAFIQGSVGFGLSLVAVPVLALIYPGAVPVVVLLVALPMASLMALREWSSMDRRGLFLITGGRVLGTAGGVWLVAAVPNGLLTALVGLFILAAVVMSLLGPQFELRDGTRFAGGVASGVMGTAAAVGGPPLALIYQNRSGPELRSTLAISFALGIVMSIAGLALAGQVTAGHLVLALKLVPGVLAGLWLGARASRRLDARWLRPAVLAFAAVSGAAVVITGLTG